MPARPHPMCSGVNRRTFLSDVGMGFTGLALGAMPARDGIARAGDGKLAQFGGGATGHFPARAKSVIFLFMIGGVSQVESFDPKPALNEYAGKTIEESPFKSTLDSPHLKKNLREVIAGLHKVHP